MQKHAYMIIAHNEFDLLETLVRLLDDPRNDLYIHIDAKVQDFDFAHFQGLVHHARLQFTPRRLSVTWGHSSQVMTELLLLQTAVAGEDPAQPYAYYHLLSGVDLPIKSNDEIHAFFAQNAGKEFVNFERNTASSSAIARIRYYHLFRQKRNQINKIFAQLFLRLQIALRVNRLRGKNLVVQKGTNWFSITGEFAKHILKKEAEIKKIFAYSYCADELLVQTLLVNSSYKENLYLNGVEDDQMACARLIDWERGRPYVFRMADHDEIMRSPAMFARKFSMQTDPDIIKKYKEIWRRKIMQNEPLISVIVPVYKVEKYLDRCVQSIVDQTYKNLEIILVDDGSPDNSPTMCDAWAEKDNRVRVIHKENGGAASARNAALDVIQGEYIAFTDSDDYIDVNMFSALYASIERNNSDISMCELHNVDLNGAILDSPKLQCEHVKSESRDALVCLVEMSSICYCVLYNKLYKRFLWKDVRFPEYRIYEDEAVMAKIYALAKTVSYVYRSLYYYVQTENSIMRSNMDERNLVILDIIAHRDRQFKQMQDDDLVIRNNLWAIRITKRIYMQCRMQKNALQKPFLVAFRKQILTNFRLLFDRQYISSKLAMNIVLFALVPRLYTGIFQAVFSENND